MTTRMLEFLANLETYDLPNYIPLISVIYLHHRIILSLSIVFLYRFNVLFSLPCPGFLRPRE